MKIVILGGGFGGIRAALDLAKQNLPDVRIQLISDLPHFEYHAALYRVVTGRSPLQVCVPLREIFLNTPVDILRDRVNRIDLAGKVLSGESGSRYSFDYLVIALGSETSYFGIGGLPEFSFGFKSISEALRLKHHLHELFHTCASEQDNESKVCGSHLVVVGGGASGVELAGELAVYSKVLAQKHGLDPTLITIDLIEAAPRLLPILSPSISEQVKVRLHGLGVNIFLNRTLMSEEVGEIKLKDMSIQAKTIIWTAGVKNNSLLAGVIGLEFDKKGRVIVDETLRVKNYPNVFVIGDSAAMLYPGMAQTAVSNGRYVARAISSLVNGKLLPKYRPEKPFTSVPVGPGWAATSLGHLTIYGWLGWCFRRLADFRYFYSILPMHKALLAFGKTRVLSESCPVCNPDGQVEFK
ncbi:NAD(P)/FAD-dependent oxidoreductase [Candidatus Nomurabacteria bacterium]|nr:NAD(P)/FAD-dependent oxidoreductase [Candidatus Nomurabacteria bacterium]